MTAAAQPQQQLPMLRWSSVRSCPRKAVYEQQGAPARERTERERRILYRGRTLGRDYAAFVASTFGEDNVRTEVKVEWPLGIGHIDVFIVPTETALEVLSSAHASEQTRRSKLLQLVGYMEHYPPAKNGALVVLDPVDLSEELFPLARSSKLYAELAEEAHDRIAQVMRWWTQGELPARVCRRRNDAIGRFCLNADHCFEGFVEPPLPQVDDEQTRTLVAEFARIKARELAAGRDKTMLEKERKQIEELIAGLPQFADRTGKWLVGGVELSRSHVQRGDTVDVRKLEDAGMDDIVEQLHKAGMVKPGASYFTTQARATEAAPNEPVNPEDYGDVPF